MSLLLRLQNELARLGFSVDDKVESSIDISFAITCVFLWTFLLFTFKYTLQSILHLFCSSLPPSRVRLPPAGWTNQPGHMLPWGTIVSEASLSELEEFLDFRKVCPKTDAQGRVSKSELQKLAHREAINYKFEIMDIAARTYNHEVYTRGNKNFPWFVAHSHWNGWRGFWAEMGGYGQNLFSGNLAYAFEHACVGLLALYFLYTGNIFAYKLALYFDLGFNVVDLFLMSLSLFLKKDVTFYSGFGVIFGAAGIFRLLVLHHLGAAVLELCALATGDTLEIAKVGAELMVALVGTTGLVHFLCITAHFTPIRENTILSFLLYATMLGLMLWYRVFFWVFLVYRCLRLAFAVGWVIGIVNALGLALFTLFNLDLTRHYMKLARKFYLLLAHGHKE